MIAYLKRGNSWTVRLDDDFVFRSDDSPRTADTLNTIIKLRHWRPHPDDGNNWPFAFLQEAGRRLKAEVVIVRTLAKSPPGRFH